VVGPENRLALPALERLLAGDDLTQIAALFNPLLLVGPSGTGKSHLARGITRRWKSFLDDTHGKAPAGPQGRRRGPSPVRVEYLTAIDFARQLRAAHEENCLEAFRERLSTLRLLVVEDLQNLPTSLFVQRELRDTLDRLELSGAAVVLTTQQPPAALAGLEAGLRDRLVVGLALRLQPPGLEARVELLKLAATARGSQLDDQQLEKLAQKTEGPVPHLFRALAEHELLSQDRLPETHRPLPLKPLIAIVARYFSLTQTALCGPARRKSLVYARGIAMHLARTLTDLSYAQIGQGFGGRDHSTVMNAIRTTQKKLAADANAQQDLQELNRILTAV
jgi:chromosomal replication initiator protein